MSEEKNMMAEANEETAQTARNTLPSTSAGYIS